MAVPTDITAGTLTITNGSTAVTGSGTAWLASDLRQGDIILWIEGGDGFQTPILAGVPASNSALTLAEPWPGPTLTNVRYRIRYQWDSSRVSAQSRQLIEVLDNGNILALASLTGPGVPVFDGPHSMVIKPETDFINGVAYDVQVDTLADRAAYDGQTAGFSVLVSDVGDGRSALYSKNSNTSGDWSDPAYITGPLGPTPDIEATVTNTAPGTAPTVTPVPITGGTRLDFTLPEAEGFNNTGPYNPPNAYVRNDVVTSNGSTFIALQAVPPGTAPSGTTPPVDTAFWQVLAVKGANGTGTGDVVGPSSAVNNRIALFDGSTGKLIKDSGKLVGDLVTGPVSSVSDDPVYFTDATGKLIRGLAPVASFTFEGDSITYGETTATPSTMSWPAKFMTTPFAANATAWRNRAVSGSTVAIMSARYSAQVYPHRPAANGGDGGARAFLFVMIGHNDTNISGANRSAAQVTSDINSYVNTARADGFEVVVLSVLPSKFALSPNTRKKLINKNILEGSIINAYRVLDAAAILQDPLDTRYYSDGAHLTVQGNTVLASDIAKMMAGVYRPETRSRIIGFEPLFTDTLGGKSSINFNDLAEYRMLDIKWDAFFTGAAGGALIRISSDNSTFPGGASDYGYIAGASGAPTNADGVPISMDGFAGNVANGKILVTNFNGPNACLIRSEVSYFPTAGGMRDDIVKGYRSVSGPFQALQILLRSGSFTNGTISVSGIKG